MSYGDYLLLNLIFDVQYLLLFDYNEMLFIIQYQMSELWMKFVLFELCGVFDVVCMDVLLFVFKMFVCVLCIFEQLVQVWNVLLMMMLFEYLVMWLYFGQLLGFQLYQYCQFEFLFGNKNVQMLQLYVYWFDIFEQVCVMFEVLLFYDEVVCLFVWCGFLIVFEWFECDWMQLMWYDEMVEVVWFEVYCYLQQYWELYEMVEELVDFEDVFCQWCFCYVMMVECIIGFKQGIGGMSGVLYLCKMFDVVLFFEFWYVCIML